MAAAAQRYRGQVGGGADGGAQEEDVGEDRGPGATQGLGEAGVEEVGPVEEQEQQVGAGADQLGQHQAPLHLLLLLQAEVVTEGECGGHNNCSLHIPPVCRPQQD